MLITMFHLHRSTWDFSLTDLEPVSPSPPTSNHWYTSSTIAFCSGSASRCANHADSSETWLHLLGIHAAASQDSR